MSLPNVNRTSYAVPTEEQDKVLEQPDRGILIAVEGIDGAGKTTQVGLLAGLLESTGENVTTSKEPTAGRWGRKIKESASNGRMSLQDELAAFVKDRTEHVKKKIRPALEAGHIVILDRYFYSTIAYQGSRGADPRIIREDMEARFPIPDAVFVLDLDPTLSLFRIARLRSDEPNHFENIEGLQRAREVFNSLVGGKVHRIDGSRSIQAVHEEIGERFIEGALKKRCAKVYGCDDPTHCSFRFSGTCQWWNLANTLRAQLRATV